MRALLPAGELRPRLRRLRKRRGGSESRRRLRRIDLARPGCPAGGSPNFVALRGHAAAGGRRSGQPRGGNDAAPSDRLALVRGAFRQGRDPQPDMVLQGPAGERRGLLGGLRRRPSHRHQLIGQCRGGGRILCRARRPPLRGAHLQGRRGSYGGANPGGRRDGSRMRGEGRSLAHPVAGGGEIRLVPDLALFRTHGGKQPYRHRGIQDAGLRNRGKARLVRAGLVRSPGVLRRRAVRAVEGVRRDAALGMDGRDAPSGRGGGFGIALLGAFYGRSDAARRRP